MLKEIIGIDVDFPLVDTGYSTIEIDQLLIDIEPQDRDGDPADDLLPETDEGDPVVAEAGDLWICGRHAIFCGSALLRDSYERLLDSSAAELVMTDPPYNRAARAIGGSGKIVHADFAMAAGEMAEEEFEAFLYAAFAFMAEFSRDGSIHFCLYGLAPPA